jgi:DNA invertase Pin-like site-specific DNA recombinase
MPRKTDLRGAGAPDPAPPHVAYYRVSTASQGASGLGLAAQRATVEKHLATIGGRLVAEFTDVESGKRNDRPELARALVACRSHRATLVVAKIDRLARNTAFLLSIAEGVGDAGVVFCDLPLLPPGPMGRFFLTLMAAVAELEAGLISQRTKSALAAAKARGIKLGNPHLRSDGAGPARRRSARAKAREVLPYLRAAEKAGCTTLKEKAAALSARGIPTPAGRSTWSAEQVRRIERIGEHLDERQSGR